MQNNIKFKALLLVVAIFSVVNMSDVQASGNSGKFFYLGSSDYSINVTLSKKIYAPGEIIDGVVTTNINLEERSPAYLNAEILNINRERVYGFSFVNQVYADRDCSPTSNLTGGKSYTFYQITYYRSCGWVLKAPATPGDYYFLVGWNLYIPFSVAVPVCTGPISIPWTDPMITANSTKIRKIHIDELRSWINNRRVDAGLVGYSWTDPLITANSTKIRKVHIDELRTAISGVYTACGQATPAWTDSTITANSTKIRKVHIDELRSAVSNVR